MQIDWAGFTHHDPIGDPIWERLIGIVTRNGAQQDSNSAATKFG
jgi:hypothetical protein